MEDIGSVPVSAHAPRPGEELDLAGVDRWLKENVEGLEGTAKVRQFPGGASNLTYSLHYPEHEWVLRRPPIGTKAKSAHDMGREVRFLRALESVYPYVPKVIAHCDDPTFIGCEFFVMERLNGIILRDTIPEAMAFTRDNTRRLCRHAIERLAELHRVDINAHGLSHLGKGRGYVDRQIQGWSARFRKARTDNVGDFEPVMAWLDRERPEDVSTCVIHGDFRFDNLVLDPDDPERIIGVLDWEMATLGDPLMDLGNSLAYWVEAEDEQQYKLLKRQPTDADGMLTRAEAVAYYFECMHLAPRDFVFYEVYGLFRLAVIIQQIYYRYHHGQTKDPRFAPFWMMVNYLEERCKRRIA